MTEMFCAGIARVPHPLPIGTIADYGTIDFMFTEYPHNVNNVYYSGCIIYS